MSNDNLIEAATQVRACAHAPYSKFSVGAAIAEGQKDFVAIAVVVDSDEPAVPCGACRQILAEFNPSIKIITSTVGGTTQEFCLADLLPRAKQGILE